MQTEIWKEIPGYEGLYEISSLGRVKRLAKTVKRLNRYGTLSVCKYEEKITTGSENGPGFIQVVLIDKNGKGRFWRVHNLVAAAFLGYDLYCKHSRSDMDDFIVDHINSDRADNRVENLKLVRRKESYAREQRQLNISMPGESWVPLDDEENGDDYELSNFGRVRHKNTHLGLNLRGRKYVEFRGNGMLKAYNISKLVEKYFGK